MPYYPSIPSQDIYLESYSKDDYENINKLNRFYWLFTNQDYGYDDEVLVDPEVELPPLNATVRDFMQPQWTLGGGYDHHEMEFKTHTLTANSFIITKGCVVLNDMFIQTTEEKTIDLTSNDIWSNGSSALSGSGTLTAIFGMYLDEDNEDAKFIVVKSTLYNTFIDTYKFVPIRVLTITYVSGTITNVAISTTASIMGHYGNIVEIFHPRNFRAYGGVVV